MKINYKVYIYLLLGSVSLMYACKKVEKGYISDFMYYTPNPLIATQGNVVVSKPLENDGSSGPLTVKLLEVRNLTTGKVADQMLKDVIIDQFNGEITASDSTVALVNKKIVKKPAKPLSVAEIGGRIQLSQATIGVDTGTYTIDVEASNSRGTRVLKNACRIIVAGKSHYALDAGPFYTTSDFGAETGFSDRSELPITITRDASGPNKITFVFQDKNGRAFNPSAGEVTTRGDRGNFAQMNPYFPVVRTSTSMEWEFINLPNGFPIKLGANGTGNYYRIPGSAVVENKNVNPVFFGFKVFSPGSYTVVVKIPTITKK